MNLGDVVVVIGKLDESIKKAPEGLIIGTLIGFAENQGKKVEVLLPDNTIFMGNVYDIIPYKGQE